MTLHKTIAEVPAARRDAQRAVAPDREFQRGWKVLLACLLGVTAGFSSTYFYSSGLFLVPVAKELGVTRGADLAQPAVLLSRRSRGGAGCGPCC